MKLVRIYPPNPRQGHHAQTYMLSGSPYPKFEAWRGWYEVDDATAEKLRKLRNNPQDPGSRPVFQVLTRTEAEALEEAEKERVAEAKAPIKLPKGVVEARPKAGKADRTHTPTKARVAPAQEAPPPEDWDEATNTDEDEDDFPFEHAMETADEGDLGDPEENEEPVSATRGDLTSADLPSEPEKPRRKPVTKPRKKK